MLDPQKCFLIILQGFLKQHATWANYWGLVASFKPYSRSTLCVSYLRGQHVGLYYSSVTSIINKGENILMLDYWVAIPRRNTRKIGKRVMHIRWYYSSNTWGSGPNKAKTTIYCTPTMCWVLDIHHPPSSQQSFQAMCTLHVLQRKRLNG